MYDLCEKYYKPITVWYYIADCVSWVPSLTLLDLWTNWTSKRALGMELVRTQGTYCSQKRPTSQFCLQTPAQAAPSPAEICYYRTETSLVLAHLCIPASPVMGAPKAPLSSLPDFPPSFLAFVNLRQPLKTGSWGGVCLIKLELCNLAITVTHTCNLGGFL